MKKYLLCVLMLLCFLPSTVLAYSVLLYEASGGTPAQVQIDITGDGTQSVIFDVEVLFPDRADISGIFFNFNPFPTAVADITVTGDDVSDVTFINDGVVNLGGGVTINPLGPFDAGILIGLTGDDGIDSTIFTVSSISEALYLGDYFGARLQSVGEDGEGSSKLVSSVPEPGTMLLLGGLLFGLGVVNRKRIMK
jgi:hypothetical protein